MIQRATARRVHGLTGRGCEYVARNNWKMKRRRGPCQVHRRPNPSIASRLLRGNTLSIPAHAVGKTPTHRHQSDGVHDHPRNLDRSRLIALAATNPAVSDRMLRVYVLAVNFDGEFDADSVAMHLPGFTEGQTGHLLGDLTAAGLLSSRRKVVGYKDGDKRIRRTVYRLVGGAR